MRLLQFAQGVNTALSIADTSRSLVSERGGSAQSVSGLSEQIDGVGTQLTNEIRGVGAAVQQDIRAVNSMVSTVLAQQAELHREIQQVIRGVASLNTLIQKHAHVIDEQLHFIIDEPLQNACHQLTDHLANKGIAATDDEIRPWLRTLHTLMDKDFSGIQKLAAISSSEESVLFLSQPNNADNIAFIAGRLHLLFGEMIPDKFLQLPPVSLKFYYLIATLYLKTLEKNPNLMASDKAQPICQKILNTLKTYLEFTTFLKDHPEIIQALFDRYHTMNTSKNVSKEEIYGLLHVIIPLVNNEKFNAKLKALGVLTAVSTTSVSVAADIWDHLPQSLPENERVKRLFGFLKQKNENRENTKYIILPESMKYLPIPETIKYPNWECRWDHIHPQSVGPALIRFPKRPKPPAFCSNAMLLLCLASDYKNTTFFRNSTLAQHVWDCWESSECSHAHNCPLTENYNTNLHSYYKTLEKQLPVEYDAILTSVERGVLESSKLKSAFQYYKSICDGNLVEAQRNKADPYCLLFLVSVIGRWDIFETYAKQFSLPADFNFAIAVGTLTPEKFAKQLGHTDVEAGIKLGLSGEFLRHVRLEAAKTEARLSIASGSVDIWDHLPKTLAENERVEKLLVFLSQDNAPVAVNSKYMILPDGMTYVQIPSCLTGYNSQIFPWGDANWGYPKTPKPAAFCTNGVLFLLLASGYTSIDYIRNSTLLMHVRDLFANNPYIESHFHGRMTEITTSGVQHVTDAHKIWDDLEIKNEPLPREYSAILTSATNGILKNLKNAFHYHKLFSKGKLAEAKLFSEQNIVDPTCLLFLVSITGQLTIFENFVKQFPLAENFNYFPAVENSTLTPFTFAIQFGRKNVVAFLLQKIKQEDIARISIEAKSAAQYAREKGFEDIAVMLENAQNGILPSVATTSAESSDYEQGLKKMCADVEASKTKLATYVPVLAQPVAQPVASATSVQAVEEPLSDGEETDTEHEDDLNAAVRTFFTKQNMHAGRTAFCHKPNTRPHNRPGFRFFDNALFQNGTQRRAFGSFLATEPFYFKVDTVKQLDNTVRVKLLTGK